MYTCDIVFAFSLWLCASRIALGRGSRGLRSPRDLGMTSARCPGWGSSIIIIYGTLLHLSPFYSINFHSIHKFKDRNFKYKYRLRMQLKTIFVLIIQGGAQLCSSLATIVQTDGQQTLGFNANPFDHIAKEYTTLS